MMKVLCVLAALCLSLVLAADPTPTWPIAFSSTMDLFRRSQHQYLVTRWFRDEKAQMERFDTSGQHGYDIDIRRYDEGKRYTIYHVNDEVKCVVTDLNGDMPTIDFSDYRYNGQAVVDSMPVYEFDSTTRSAMFTKYFQGIGTQDPVRLETAGPMDETLNFFEFDAGSQDESLFNVTAVAPGVPCNSQARNPFGSVRMVWLDAKNAKYPSNIDLFSPPLITPPSNITYGGGDSCQTGQASYYSCSGSGACAACTPSEYMAAHVTLPCGTSVTVTDTANGRSVTVNIEDRGPYVPGRIIDMNYAPAEALDMITAGVVPARVCW